MFTPIIITIAFTVLGTLSQMKAGKAQGPSGIVVEMIRAAGDMGTSMICGLTAAIVSDGKAPSDWEQFHCLPLQGKGGCIGKGQLPWSQADRAGPESSGEDSGQLRHLVVYWRFPLWLHPRQWHNRCNLCCRQLQEKYLAANKRLSVHGFRRPGEGIWLSTLEGYLVGAEKTWCGGVDCATGAGDVCKCVEPCRCWWGVHWLWSEGRWSSSSVLDQPTLHHCAWSLVTRVPLLGPLGGPLCWWPCYHRWITRGMC